MKECGQNHLPSVFLLMVHVSGNVYHSLLQVMRKVLV
jgi:hypothetical protein